MFGYQKKLLASAALVVAGGAFSLCASEVRVHLPDGNQLYIDVGDDVSHSALKNEIEFQTGFSGNDLVITYSPQDKEVWVELIGDELQDEELYPKKTQIGYRNYDAGYTDADKKEIRFILKTLAQKSLASLLTYKSQMEYAGQKIDHLHPLCFLECIFNDEELKVYIHNIKKRGSWIWSEFIKGLKASLQDEAEIGNLSTEQLSDFSSKISVDITLYHQHIKSHNWEDFIKTLIVHVPRSGDSGRYDQ